MKQYKITSDNIYKESNDDCYLAADDPIHELKIAHNMGGLGSSVKLAEYNASLKPMTAGSNKGQIQREQGIKPGTDDWFKLWFGKGK